MKKSVVLLIVLALLITPLSPSSAASKSAVVKAAFKSLLGSATTSLIELDQEYEIKVDLLDSELAEAKSSAEATYEKELSEATTLYIPLIAAANKSADDSLKLFNASNKVKVGPGGGFFGGTNLARYLDCTPPEIKPNGLPFEIAKRYCSNNNNYAKPGDPSPTRPGANIGGEDWQPGDITTIQLFNSGEDLVLNGISAGYIVPLDLIAFDSSRLANKKWLAEVTNLTTLNGKARTAARTKSDNAVTVATNARTSALADLDDEYETDRSSLEAQETAAGFSLLAAKRANKDRANFDAAFAVAYKFEYNRQIVGEIADDAWTGEWTFRTINSIIKVNKLAATGDSIGSKYSKDSAIAFNKTVGKAFTNEPEFRAALKVVTAIYRQSTKIKLKF